MRKCAALFTTASIVLLNAASPASSAPTEGVGATFPQPVYQKWAEAYARETGVQVTYKGTGSGDGVAQIERGAVAFGGTDVPVPSAFARRAGITQFPTVVGGILPVVNLEGVSPGELVLDGPTLARLMSGNIARWDDPALRRLNPGVRLPALDVLVVHRSDASGTTFVLSDYLSRVASGWIGKGSTLRWPTGMGVAGSDALVQAVGSTKGAIGYVEFAYAKRANLTYVNMVNADGRVVQPTPASFAAASANTDWNDPKDPPSPLDAKGGASWPLTTATFVIVRSRDVPGPHDSAVRFFGWALARGGSIAEDLDYVPLPADVVRRLRAQWGLVDAR